MILRINGLVEGHQEIVENFRAIDLMVEDPEFVNQVEVTLEVEKEPQDIKILGKVKTVAQFVCDRCLDEFPLELNGEFNVIISQSVKHLVGWEEEDIIKISPTTSEVDLTSFIHDALLLSVPMKKLCHIDCLGICPRCGANLNHEPCSCHLQPVDERWSNLMNLFKDNSEA